MSTRKTLNLRPTSQLTSETSEMPGLKKKGRGWEISEKRLDALHDRARELKRHASPAHKALAERFAKADLGKFKFTRHAVVGSAIVDFNCHLLGMAVVIDEGDQPDTIAKRSDRTLEAVGIRVMRITADEILTDMDSVLQRITAGMRLRMGDKQERRGQHEATRRDARTSRGHRE